MSLTDTVPALTRGIVLLGLLATASAQCADAWVPGSQAGADGEVTASMSWDPDGAGPATPVLVVAGAFQSIGPIVARGIATWDPATGAWSSLGGGITAGLPAVYALAVLPTGELVAGGWFTGIGGATAMHIAKWNGVAWSPLGSGLGGANGVLDLTVLANGDLVAAGMFTQAGGVATAGLARWDGSTWSAFGSGQPDTVYAIGAMPNGDLLVVGGYALTSPHVPQLVRWNGTAWSSIGTGFSGYSNNTVDAMLVLPSGDVLFGGHFLAANGTAASSVARWDGTNWSAFGAGIAGGSNASVYALAAAGNGGVVAAGTFTDAGGLPAANIARWDGTAWSPLGTGTGVATGSAAAVETLAVLPNGDVVTGGSFATAGGVDAPRLARWDAAGWHALGTRTAPNGILFAASTLANGDVVIGGDFTAIGGVAANRVARWSNGGWVPLGTGVDGLVAALAVMPGGDLVVGGAFTNAGGAPASHIARWNGVAWSPLGSGTDAPVSALSVAPGGDLIVGGSFGVAGGTAASFIARWDGSTWSPLGAGRVGPVIAAAVLQNGDVVVSNSATFGFTAELARWNGSGWIDLGLGSASLVRVLLVRPSGELVAGGSFPTAAGVPAGNIAMWNGAAWSPLGGGVGNLVASLAELPGGDLAVGGLFQTAGGAPASRLARWSGAVWTELGGGVGTTLQAGSPSVLALAADSHGRLIVGGQFEAVGDTVSPQLAVLETPCPATAVAFGAGCTGSGGPNLLTATGLPWVGGSYRGRATGLPPLGLAAIVTGFTQLAVPLSMLFAQAPPGCTGHTTADFVELALPTSGFVTTRIDVPVNPALVGFQCQQYVLTFEFDAAGQLTAVTATNALSLRVGIF